MPAFNRPFALACVLAALVWLPLAAGCARAPGPAFAAGARQPLAARNHGAGRLALFVQPEAGDTPVVAAIDGAQRSVWLQIYLLTSPAVIDALARAAARDLDVRVLIEESPYNPGNPGGGLTTNQETARRLATQRVRVAWTDPRFNFTHAKSLLIDGQTAYQLTYNLTRAGSEENREFGVVNTSPSDVGELKRIFLADWNRTPYVPLDPDLVVSPDNARLRILGLLAKAERELLVGVEAISDPEVVALLTTKRQQGVDVRVLVANVKKLTPNLPPARQLTAAGVPVRSQSRPYLHAKYALVDGEAAYVGSINLTTNSLDANRELGLLLADPAAIAELRRIWDTDWERAAPIEQPTEPAQPPAF